MCVKFFKKENLVGCILNYASGSVMRKYKLCENDLAKTGMFFSTMVLCKD